MWSVTTETVGNAPDRRREQRGWVFYDWANSVFPTSVITVFGALYLTAVAADAAIADKATNGANPCPADADGNANKLVNCQIDVFGLHFQAGSLWGYLLAVATVIQVLIVPLMGAIADRTQNKKRMLAIFAFGGATATALMSLVSGTNWQLGVILFILGNIGFGTSVVIYYSFIPDIATADERDGLSTRGWAFGYLGSGCALLLQLGDLPRARLARPDRGQRRADRVPDVGPVVGRVHADPAAAAAQPPAPARRRARRERRRRRLPGARQHDQARPVLPADARVPRHVPDLHRRHRDRGERVGAVRQRGAALRRTRC